MNRLDHIYLQRVTILSYPSMGLTAWKKKWFHILHKELNHFPNFVFYIWPLAFFRFLSFKTDFVPMGSTIFGQFSETSHTINCVFTIWNVVKRSYYFQKHSKIYMNIQFLLVLLYLIWKCVKMSQTWHKFGWNSTAWKHVCRL